MNIALAQSEISEFLERRPTGIQVLWAKDELARSIFVENRYTAELSHSSIFDVLDFYLRDTLLPNDATDSEREAWLAAIDEFVETGNWAEDGFEDMVFKLMELYLDFSGAPCEPTELSMRATKVMIAYFALLGFVQAEARAQHPGGHLQVV